MNERNSSEREQISQMKDHQKTEETSYCEFSRGIHSYTTDVNEVVKEGNLAEATLSKSLCIEGLLDRVYGYGVSNGLD